MSVTVYHILVRDSIFVLLLIVNNIKQQRSFVADFGLDTLAEHMEKTDFPWLVSNVIDNETGRPLADGKVHLILDWGGRKIGIIGLVEREWLDTLANIDTEEIDYTDYVDAASMLATELKRKGDWQQS